MPGRQQTFDAFTADDPAPGTDTDATDNNESCGDLPPCPWCYASSETFTHGGPVGEGVSCECGAVIPVSADWYRDGIAIGIDC